MTITTIGTFDGLHRGHEAVLQTLLSEARQRDLSPLVITFTNHPLEVVAPHRAPKALMLPAEKESALRKRGTEVKMLTFDPSLCSFTAAKWLQRLHDNYGVRALVLGYDNTFGSDGRHISRQEYHRLAAEAGIEIIDAPVCDGCSSSAVRRALAEGRIDDANAILGRKYSLTGTVVHGQKLGRTLGFPTANLDIDHRLLLPPGGVYVVDVKLPDDPTTHRAVLNIGTRPTVDGTRTTIECHILDWQGDLYSRPLTISFIRRLRDEQRFPTIDALKAAIAADIAAALK